MIIDKGQSYLYPTYRSPNVRCFKRISLEYEIRKRDPYRHKYGCEMAEYVHRSLLLEGDSADSEITGEFISPHAYRFGKRVLYTYDSGFVTLCKFDTVAEAVADIAEYGKSITCEACSGNYEDGHVDGCVYEEMAW